MEIMASSIGEEVIEDYLTEAGIDFKREVKISGLKEDYADYRIVDFYLPNYKIYIEFLGRWEIEENKEKYRKKKEIYTKNNVPCIYIYPDNLGIIDYVFERRIREVFKMHPELKFQLFLFNLHEFWSENWFAMIIDSALLYYIPGKLPKIIFSIVLILIMKSGIKSTFLK